MNAPSPLGADLAAKCPVLSTMIDTNTTVTPSGEVVPLHSGVHPLFAATLHRILAELKSVKCLEIGMANGVSSLAILTALRDGGNPDAHLTSIDPEQSKGWHGCGAHAVERAGYARLHTLIEDFDYLALPALLAQKTQIDFAYIDGWHTFDYTLLDWWYVDRMLKVGGVVALNDTGWPAVAKVIDFFLGHRKYKEADVGLPRLVSPATNLRQEDRYFVKMADWEPNWDFFAPF